MMGEMRQVVVFRGEDGLWVADCLSLPGGGVSQGRTREDCLPVPGAIAFARLGRLGFDYAGRKGVIWCFAAMSHMAKWRSWIGSRHIACDSSGRRH